jgi:hypothetical protein
MKRARLVWNFEFTSMQEYVCKCIVGVYVCAQARVCFLARVGWKYNKEIFLLSTVLLSIFFPASASEAFSIQTTQREVRNTLLGLLCPNVWYEKNGEDI